MSYDIAQHNHRLAAWAAGTAARASKLCRFDVSLGKGILEAIGFVPELDCPSKLPNPESLDEAHAEWRDAAIVEAANRGISGFTHGVAAKLINCYLKVRFVCANHHDHPRVRALHPPIDSLLLKSLAAQNFGGLAREWRKHDNRRWSKYDTVQYQEVIDLIRDTLPEGKPMWTIEEHWIGHQ